MVYCVRLLSAWAPPAWVRIPYAPHLPMREFILVVEYQVRNLVTGVRFTHLPLFILLCWVLH